MLAIIYDSVNLPPRKMKFTSGINLPSVKNHWTRMFFCFVFSHFKQHSKLSLNFKGMGLSLTCLMKYFGEYLKHRKMENKMSNNPKG